MVRGVLEQEQTWSWRNLTARSLDVGGTIAAGLEPFLPCLACAELLNGSFDFRWSIY
jgi:hypothetical protein